MSAVSERVVKTLSVFDSSRISRQYNVNVGLLSTGEVQSTELIIPVPAELPEIPLPNDKVDSQLSLLSSSKMLLMPFCVTSYRNESCGSNKVESAAVPSSFKIDVGDQLSPLSLMDDSTPWRKAFHAA